MKKYIALLPIIGIYIPIFVILYGLNSGISNYIALIISAVCNITYTIYSIHK